LDIEVPAVIGYICPLFSKNYEFCVPKAVVAPPSPFLLSYGFPPGLTCCAIKSAVLSSTAEGLMFPSSSPSSPPSASVGSKQGAAWAAEAVVGFFFGFFFLFGAA
jgi:hypothetical protein